MVLFTVNEEKCVKCGLCAKVCPSWLISFNEEGFPLVLSSKESSCIECGHCALFCPVSANSLSFLKENEICKKSELPFPSESEAINFLKTRRSIRRFKNEVISKEIFAQIFETVNQAPTASNKQAVRWIVSKEPLETKKIVRLILTWLSEVLAKDPQSPIALLATVMLEKDKEQEDGLLRGAPHVAIAIVPANYKWPEDGAIALTYLELAAHAVGVGACWGGFLTMAIRHSEELRKFLGINDDEHVCGAQMLGYPQFKPVRQFAPRRNININWL